MIPREIVSSSGNGSAVCSRSPIVLERRDKACDIRIVNKEVSRRHLELSVNEDGRVSVVSLGREPVLVNKEQVLSPRVLQTGDKIEVLLEGRTREFFFQAAPHTVGREAREKSVGSPLMPSSIANLRSDAATEAPGGVGVAEEVGAVEDVGAAEEVGAADVAPSPLPSVQPNVISAAVTHMVQDIIDRLLTSVDASSSILTPVPSSVKRKSVRFVASTPEGDARDATMTIRCFPKEDCERRAVLIEDNTLAISEWGFKSMKNEAEQGEDGKHGDTCSVMAEADRTNAHPGDEVAKMEDLVDEAVAMDATRVHGADKDDKVGQQLTPASIGERVPLTNQYRPISSPEMPNRLNFEAGAMGAISQGTPGIARAPATTPVTAAKPFVIDQNRVENVDFAALAQKLEEIAAEHDVQFELPKDFMRFTPMPSVTKSKRKSFGEALSSLSVGRTPKRLSISSNGNGGSVEYDLPQDFMRFTPMNLKSAVKNIEQTMTAVGGIHESLDDGAEEIATLRSVAHVAHDLADALDKVASTKKSMRAKTPGVKITIVERGSTFKTANPEVKILFNTDQAPLAVEKRVEEAAAIADVPGFPLQQADEAESPEEVSEARKAQADTKTTKLATANEDGVGSSLAAMDLMARFNAAHTQAQAYKTQALALGKHLKKSSAKLCRARATSKVLSIKYRAEKAKRMELQNMILQLIKDSEVGLEADPVGERDDADMTDIDVLSAKNQGRVIVLGAGEPRNATHIEMAGKVAVVRPSPALNQAATPIQPQRTRRSSVVTIKSASKSVKRVSLGGDVMRVVVDNVEVPQWIFEKEDQEFPGDASETDADQDEKDAQEERNALETLADALKSPLPASLSKQEQAQHAAMKQEGEHEDEVSSDVCFVCGVGDDGDILLLCDSCDNACHLGCCKPARKTVPKGDWFCAPCKAASKKRKADTAAIKASKENICTKKAPTTKSRVASGKPARPVRASSRRALNSKP